MLTPDPAPTTTAEAEQPAVTPAQPEPEPEPAPAPAGPRFSYCRPGQLVEGAQFGVPDQPLFAQVRHFPLQSAPAYLNSQVYGVGGKLGPPSNRGWRDPANFVYPWRDTFCETGGRSPRGGATTACPPGGAHVGVDVRASDGVDSQHVVVAVAAGRVSISGHTVTVESQEDGARYKYMHMNPNLLQVQPGDEVQAGEPIGFVSNFYTSPTTVHLHFEVWQNVLLPNGSMRNIPRPPYATLVEAYSALLAGQPGAGDAMDCPAAAGEQRISLVR